MEPEGRLCRYHQRAFLVLQLIVLIVKQLFKHINGAFKIGVGLQTLSGVRFLTNMYILGQLKYPTAIRICTTQGDQNRRQSFPSLLFFVFVFLLIRAAISALSHINQLAISVFLRTTGHLSKLSFECFETLCFKLMIF